MTAQIIDFATARARHDPKWAAELAMREVTMSWLRPWASMDELPDITSVGQALVAQYVLHRSK